MRWAASKVVDELCDIFLLVCPARMAAGCCAKSLSPQFPVYLLVSFWPSGICFTLSTCSDTAPETWLKHRFLLMRSMCIFHSSGQTHICNKFPTLTASYQAQRQMNPPVISVCERFHVYWRPHTVCLALDLWWMLTSWPYVKIVSLWCQSGASPHLFHLYCSSSFSPSLQLSVGSTSHTSRILFFPLFSSSWLPVDSVSPRISAEDSFHITKKKKLVCCL